LHQGGHTNGQQISADHAQARMAKFSRGVAKALPLAPADGRGGESIDIALAAVYLGSDESRWVTGIDMLVDGGMDAVKGDHGAIANAQREMWAARDASKL
jgi:NAD(P)-dependent dehydrogenase (short-subunit alcohol dehydrogenase family)